MYNEADILNDFDSSMGKIEDAGTVVRGGGIDRYWLREGVTMDIHKLFNERPTYDWLFDSNMALSHFNLRSIEFGNWMNQEDRANFLYASMLSLHHLAKILSIDDAQIGMNSKLSIALGARGKGQASGHYEPNPFAVINITKTKGFGVLAHEFAHAFDNIISYYTGEKHQTYVSGGRTTRKGYDTRIAKNGNWFEKQFEDFFNVLYYQKSGDKTVFHDRLNELEDYWNRRTEVLARTFEVYTLYKLNQLGLKNNFLVEQHYNIKEYPKETLMLQVATLIDKVFKRGFNLMKRGKPLSGVSTVTGYKGFRKTLKERASIDDTLENMQRIAIRDTEQVSALAEQLKGNTVAKTSENIWNYLRANTRYKLDQDGIEELRTPARSLVDGKAGLTDANFGIDCDDYTMLVSALLLNLSINHEYRVTAYKEVGRFQHIYPVAFDSLGNEYVIDVVPEIPHFNYEAKPIIDIKKIPMELHELSGIEDTVTENEVRNDLLEDINQPFELSGIDDELYDEDELLESEFLSGFGEVENEEDADIVLNGTDDAIALLENGILAEVNKAKQSLIKEQREPTVLSQTINVNKEIDFMDDIMSVWQDDAQRNAMIQKAIRSGSSYANFYKAIQMSLDKLENQDLQGIEDEFDEPIYLARVDMDDFKLEHLLTDEEDLEGLGDLGFFRRRRKRRRRRGGFFKRIFKGIGKGIKKVVKAIVRFNPATILVRAAIRLVLKINLFKIASRLIYGYLSESQAKAQGLDLNEWRKLVRAKNKALKFYTKIGGKSSKFKKAIVRGKAAKKTGLRLGAVVTGGSTAAAGSFMVFVKMLLKKINVGKLFKKVVDKIRKKRGDTATNTTQMQTFSDPTNDFPTSASNRFVAPTEADKPKGFKEKVKAFFTKHKKKILVVGIGGVLVIVAVVFWNKSNKKKKRSLAGVKAARTRARNRKRQPQLKGSTTILRVPSKSVSKARVTRRSNGSRLKLMHKKAKELRKKHPKTKYSMLLKRASKLI